MPADTGRSDLRTQEGERRAHAQGATRLNQRGPRPFQLRRDQVEALSGESAPDWGKVGGKARGPGRWKRGWKDPLGVRGRNREQAKEKKGHRHSGLRLGDEAL